MFTPSVLCRQTGFHWALHYIDLLGGQGYFVAHSSIPELIRPLVYVAFNCHAKDRAKRSDQCHRLHEMGSMAHLLYRFAPHASVRFPPPPLFQCPKRTSPQKLNLAYFTHLRYSGEHLQAEKMSQFQVTYILAPVCSQSQRR